MYYADTTGFVVPFEPMRPKAGKGGRECREPPVCGPGSVALESFDESWRRVYKSEPDSQIPVRLRGGEDESASFRGKFSGSPTRAAQRAMDVRVPHRAG